MIKLYLDKIQAQNHSDSVIDLLRKRIRKVLLTGYVGRNPNRVNLNQEIRIYLNDLLTNDVLNDLLICAPDNFINVITFIRNNYPNFLLPKSFDNLILRNIFISHGYDNN